MCEMDAKACKQCYFESTQLSDTVLNHQEIEAWVAAMKTLKDTSLTKAERKEKLAKDLESVPVGKHLKQKCAC
ncbi:hypothetical protein Y032_0446g1607 [Ancylostoma ceylanicum]|uniref:Uncharacterized protein n=1 Tax=Ancylostoma ceylanicum TaxID=53326 RepID=A0A016WZ14_9BILA|nr:hypothetical protein Y032_0446g1607 [Ancylostoma ceylanicum]